MMMNTITRYMPGILLSAVILSASPVYAGKLSDVMQSETWQKKADELLLEPDGSLRQDALIVKVEKDGPACHQGTDSCFNDTVWESDTLHEFTLDGLMTLIAGRKKEKKEGSYTTYLFEKGLDKILKKVGEESTEVIIAAKDQDRKNTIYEIADLTYHVMVLMIEAGISLEDIHRELASRHVIDHKVKQEKMA